MHTDSEPTQTDKNPALKTSPYLAAEDAAIAMMESAARTERRRKESMRRSLLKLFRSWFNK